MKKRGEIAQCYGKMQYTNGTSAMHAATVMRKTYKEKFVYYECPYCTFWHVGRMVEGFNSEGGKENKMIYETAKYEEFSNPTGQRDLRDRHIGRLKESMQKYGYLPQFPIVVTKDMTIVDGNHRLNAAKDLGIPVHYCFVNGAIDKNEMMIDVNRSSLTWSDKDYLKNYTDRGYREYLKINEYLEGKGKGLNLGSFLRMVSLTSKMGRDDFRTGRFVFPSTPDFAKTKALLELVMGYIPKASSSYGVAACCKIAKHPDFKIDRMQEKLHNLQERLHPCPSTDDYITMLMKVYNHGYRKNAIEIS